MKALAREWPRLDPRTGIAVFALWAGCFGVTLAGPGEAFPTSPIYAGFRDLNVPENLLGWVMLGTAALMVSAIRGSASLPLRLIASFLGGMTWVLIGGVLLWGGRTAGLVSSSATFSLIGGFGLLYSIRQWLEQP